MRGFAMLSILPKAARLGPLLALALLAAAACHSPKPAPPAPGELRLPEGLEQRVEQRFGTLLGGARSTRPEDAQEGPAFGLELQLLSLERMPPRGFEPLAAHTRMVANPLGRAPIRGATRLAVGAGFAQGQPAEALWEELLAGAAGRARPAGSHLGVLPQGMSVVLSLEASELIEDPDNFLREWPERGPVRKRLAAGVESRGAIGLGVGLGLANLARGAADAEASLPPPEGGRPGGEYLQEEWLVPSPRPEPDAGPLLFVVPSPFASGEGAAYAIRIELRSLGDAQAEGQVAALGESLAAAESTGKGVANAVANASPEELQRLEQERLYRSLKTNPELSLLRGLVGFLTDENSSQLAADLVLVADERLLRQWIERLPEASGDEAESSPESVPLDAAWQLERAAWLQLAQLAVAGDLELWQDALLLRHAGEVGRYPSTLVVEARRARDAQAFQASMKSENLLFLEDSNASARVRAFDWLERRGAAPAGFDPLGPKAERKRALEQPAKVNSGQ